MLRVPYVRARTPLGTWNSPAPARNAARRMPQSAGSNAKVDDRAGNPGPMSNQLYAYATRRRTSTRVARVTAARGSAPSDPASATGGDGAPEA